MNSQTILVIDDDRAVRTLLRNCLEGAGFRVLEAASADAALDFFNNAKLDLITLDLHLGGDDGFEVARTIRQTSQTPIIMVTGNDDIIDRVVGLEIGADDYITKPFHVREVVARVRSVLRRSTASTEAETRETEADSASPKGSNVIQFDGLIAVPDRYELWDRNGNLCELTSGDFKLLNVFLENPKRVLSRENLMDMVSGIDWAPLDRTIDNQVARLRKKIERDTKDPKLIKTVRGVGYTLACDLEYVDERTVPKRA